MPRPITWLETAGARARRPALEVWRGARRVARLDHRALAARARALARDLARAGLRGGDVLAVCAADPVAVATGLLAAWEVGAVALPLNVRLAPPERARVLAHAGARVGVVDRAHAGALARAGLAERRAPVRTPTGPASLRPLAASAPALLVYTSGSSGAPKGVLLAAGALDASARAVVRRLGLARGMRWLAPLPLFHVGGVAVLLRAWRAGAVPVVASSGDELGLVLGACGASHVSLVPTQLVRMLDRGLAPPLSLAVALVGGAALASGARARAVAAGWPLALTYGLTEAGSALTCTPPGIGPNEVACGAPLDGVALRIARPGADGVGEIELSGPVAMVGYWRSARVTPDGWHATGDLGRLDPRGWLVVAARADDLVVTGGENVYPAEVEAALEALPGVARACVVGVPSAEWGDEVCAAVVLRAPLSDDELRAALAPVLARYKHPRRVRRVRELPATASGKVARSVVRAWFAGSVDGLDEHGQFRDDS